MQGLHLTADLHRCACAPHWLTDGEALTAACQQAVVAAGLHSVGQLVHRFAPGAHGPGGVTVALLLAESHLCLHTWPEQGAVTLDVYVCNFSADHSDAAEQLLARLLALFEPAQVQRHALRRGTLSAPVPSIKSGSSA